MKAQYGILRFAKYKGPEIGHIEAHNERKKERYRSNPDVDTERSRYNFHLVTPQRKYRAEAERQIAGAGCRTRSDSVRIVEALVTASPEFFHGKTDAKIREYFTDALGFIKARQNEKTIVSAVIHMDEKTPHMHLTFVPLTEDGRLSAKDIVGNKKKLTWWQDEFWKAMVKKYPELERGESAAKTGRDHIPPRLYKEAIHLNSLRERISELLSVGNPLTAKARMKEAERLLEEYIPGAEKIRTRLKKFETENQLLKTEKSDLEMRLSATENAGREKLSNQLKYAGMEIELKELHQLVGSLPPEILDAYGAKKSIKRKTLIR